VAAAGRPASRSGPGPVDHGRTPARVGAGDPAAAVVDALAAGRTLAFAALGTQRAIGLVGAHNLHGLAGTTADGGTWTVCNGNLRLAPRGKDRITMQN